MVTRMVTRMVTDVACGGKGSDPPLPACKLEITVDWRFWRARYR